MEEKSKRKRKIKRKMDKNKSIFICGHCGKEDRDHIEKVICGGYVNMLCFTCRCRFEDAIRDISKKYLG